MRISTYVRRAAVSVAAAAVALAAPVAPRAQDGGVDPALFQSLEWRNIGPLRGGRSIAVSGVVGRPHEAYFGAVGGGLWKTTDYGVTWSPVTDGQIGSSSVGAVAVSESHPDVVFIGMGESCIRGNIMQGDGIYKSTDAGKTWAKAGFNTHGQTISKIRIHPTNPDVVVAAVFGTIAAPNQERGVYKSTDGGRTWKQTLFRDDKTGGVDLSIDRRNPNVMYAALWEAYRKSWQMSSGGPGSGLFKSTDGGDTWTEITRHPGLPAGVVGRIGVAVSPADSSRVYALVENDNGGLFVSDDAGATWRLASDDRRIRQRAFYYTHVTADTKDKDLVYVLNTSLYKSTDGGKTYTTIRAPHVDHHDLWVDPDDPSHLVNGNDGGGNVSINGGATWSDQDFATAQLYRLSVTPGSPYYYACGGQQDNTTVCVPAYEPPGAIGPAYFAAGGGESGYVTPHPTNHDLFYSGSQGALITRFDRATGHIRDIQPYPRFFSGEPANELPERWQWTFPIVFDPFDPKTLHISSQHVWKTTNDGQTWTRISPDLTRADPATLGDSGGPITHDMNGPEIFGTVFAIGASPVERGLLWTGSDDGLVYVTRDAGQNWANVTPPGIGDHTRISTVEPSPHKEKAGTAYVAGKRYLVPPGDRQPYLFKTTDYGRTWTKIVNGIAPHHYTHSIREDPKRPGLLFAGTEHGVYVSFDDGGRWQWLGLNMPDTQISDLAVKDDDLVAATHGRSIWVLENISTLRQLPAGTNAGALKVFEPRPAIRSFTRADVDYVLAKDAEEVTVEILDGAGQVVRTFVGTPADAKARAEEPSFFGGPPQRPPTTKAGLNRFTWDLRYPGSTVFEGMIIWSGRPQNGPVAVPGDYQVRVRALGETATVPLVIEKHPLWDHVSVADLQKQFDFALQIRDRTSDANEAVIRIRDMKAQIADRVAQSKNARLKEIGEVLTGKLSAVEEEIYQVRNRSGQDPLNFPIKINNRLASLRRSVETGDNPPTDAAYEIYEMLSADLQEQLDELAAIRAADLANFNKAAAALKLPPVAPGEIRRPE